MNWPNELPQSPLLEGFSRQKQENRSRFDPQGGRSKHVVFYTSVPEVIEMEMFLDQSQKDRFESFYEVDTLFGTQEFTIPDPNKNQTILVKFIGDPPLFRNVGFKDWIVQFALEVS